MNFLLYILIGVLGLIIGSFLNVVVLRLHTKKISRGRSKCAKCNHTLDARDLVPFFSFLFLGGRCRYCKSKISMQYPLVELFTAITYIGIYYRVLIMTGGELVSTVLYFLYFAIIFSLLISLCVYDLRHYILPWKLMKPFLILSFVGSIIISFINFDLSFLNLISGFIVAIPFYLIWYFSRGRLIGFGDIMLMCGFWIFTRR
jgi:leader peptidase (prepilin peptidase)/N-methyltransferase